MLDIVLDTLLDAIKLVPFLFVTYLLLEWIEHKAGTKIQKFTARAGFFGPALGGAIGAVPQCGFSAAAASMFSCGLISVGTLVAVFLSTSDEMLPIMISQKVDPFRILTILGIKVACGIFFGFLIDFIYYIVSPHREKREIAHVCEEEHCHCEKGILRSAIHHTWQISLFVLLITLIINLLIFLIGHDVIENFATGTATRFVIPFVTGLIGLIPNCASSVILTELFLDGMISTGAMISGLLVGSGVGLVILFRIHKNWKENLLIAAILYGIGTLVGVLFDLFGIII